MSKVLKRISKNVKEYPERMAYVTEDNTSGEYTKHTMTWGELGAISDKISNCLNKVLKTKTPVVVIGHKSPFIIATFVACSKSGRAYVPIDSSFPIGRIQDIISAVQPEVVVCLDEAVEISGAFELYTAETINKIIAEEEQGSDEAKWVQAEDTYYIIFTSGSTGIPKGVKITSECLDNFVLWAVTLGEKTNMADGSYKRYINQAPFSFDLSVFDLYLSLYTGGTLYAITKVMQSDKKNLYRFIGESNAEVWVSTPSFAEIALADESFCKDLVPNMSLFLFCGETLTNQTVVKLNNAFPKAEVVNTYGPTESTVAMTSVLITGEIRDAYNPLPIGIAKPGTYVYIMDEEGRILADGEKGEIVIVGDTVSTGYWKNEEKTSEVFGSMIVDGVERRLYHTHDKGYYKDGMLFYCGRIDLQIKLHGYRIEIEDIESNMLKAENVEQAVIMPEYVNGEVVNLVAYIVPKMPIESNLKERQNIRAELKNRIPEYMIPKKFVFRDSLPITTNGKVDRRKLKEMGNATS